MLDLIKKELDNNNVFSGELPKIIELVKKSISTPSIPDRMKIIIALSQVMLFASQFRRNIAHWNKSNIPVNFISFCLAPSGLGKDKSVSEAKKCFSYGYDKIDKERKTRAIQKAIEKASKEGEEFPDNPKVYKKYYKKPYSLMTSVTNSSAFLSHIADLEKEGLGSGFIYSGEFGSELQSNSDMTTTIKDLSELYDEGKKELKPLRDKERQTSDIINMPVSALLVGSPENILFDDNIKRKFKMEFSTKLSRRTFFNYSPELLKRKEYKNVADMLKDKILYENNAIETREFLKKAISDVTTYQLPNINKPIKVSKEVRELFEIYLEYNFYKSKKIPRLYPMTKLSIIHGQWRALKLSGAIAFFNQHEEITKQDYIQAISCVELLDKDLQEFEIELVKEPYELFSKYMQATEENNYSEIGLHQLRKMGYIPTTGKPEQRLKELIELVSSYDNTGIYTPITDNKNKIITGIKYEKFIKTEYVGISYLKCPKDKKERIYSCHKGYNYSEVSFSDLSKILSKDYAYTPFKFKDGNRSQENVEGGCKWVCLDVDKSVITDLECHSILKNYNHHIVRTSDPNNEFKFRVLIELDSLVDIPDISWKPFVQSIAKFLALEVDILPKSQIFFSYENRQVYSVTDKNKLEVKEHLLNAYSITNNSEIEVDNLSAKEKSSLLNNKFDTFERAFEAIKGERSLRLIWAAKYAKELGASLDYTTNLLIEINNYWIQPLEQTRFETTLLNQIKKWSW